MKGSQVRYALRIIHIAFAVLLGALIYSPLRESYIFTMFTLYIFAPIVAITGLLMWKQNEIMKRIRK